MHSLEKKIAFYDIPWILFNGWKINEWYHIDKCNAKGSSLTNFELIKFSSLLRFIREKNKWRARKKNADKWLKRNGRIFVRLPPNDIDLLVILLFAALYPYRATIFAYQSNSVDDFRKLSHRIMLSGLFFPIYCSSMLELPPLYFIIW